MKHKFLVKAILLLASSLTAMSGATISPSLPRMAEVFAATPGAEFLSKRLFKFNPVILLWHLFPPLFRYFLAHSFGYGLQNEL
ncbi:MAG: hypothetical protein AAGN35_26430 [Bacteroidota bacterium]